MKKNNSFRKRSKKYTPEQMAYLERWDEYFDGNTQFQYLSRCTEDKKIALRDWFVKHLASTKNLWLLECGLIYSVDNKNKNITELLVPRKIYRISVLKTPEMLQPLAGKVIEKALGGSFKKERGLGANDWHKSAFRYNNNFFFKELGYSVSKIELAPGWHRRVGTGAIINEMKNYEEWHEFYLREIERISDRFIEIVRGKYEGAKIFDAPITTDTDGILWKSNEGYFGDETIKSKLQKAAKEVKDKIEIANKAKDALWKEINEEE